MDMIGSFLKFSVMLFIFLLGVALATVIGLVIKTVLRTRTELSPTAIDAISAISGIFAFVILIGPVAYLAKNTLPVFLMTVDIGKLAEGIGNFIEDS